MRHRRLEEYLLIVHHDQQLRCIVRLDLSILEVVDEGGDVRIVRRGRVEGGGEGVDFLTETGDAVAVLQQTLRTQ